MKRSKPIPIRPAGSRAAIAAELRALAARVESGDVDAIGVAIQTREGDPQYDLHLVTGSADDVTLLVAADGLAMRLRALVWGGKQD